MALIAPFTKEGLRTDNRYAIRVARPALQTVPDSVFTPIEFTTIGWTTGTGMWTAGAPALVSIAQGGIYIVTAVAQWDFTVAGDVRRFVGIYDSAAGAIIAGSELPGGVAGYVPAHNLATIQLVTSARSFALYAWQQSGGAPADVLTAHMEVVRVR